VTVNRKELQQNQLWTLEDDFEGRSTPSAVTQQEQQAQATPDADQKVVRGAEPAVVEQPAEAERQPEQPSSEISFDGVKYTYTGYVLGEDGQYQRVTVSFTCAEIDVYPSEDPERVRAMVDAVGRDAGRQAEIKRFGKRVWHTPYRSQVVALQGLDYVLRHDVDLVAACYPHVVGFYAADAASADRWTMAMYDAYKAFVRRGEREALLRLLAEAGIPPATLHIEGVQEEVS
jgi:hypothetical protein